MWGAQKDQVRGPIGRRGTGDLETGFRRSDLVEGRLSSAVTTWTGGQARSLLSRAALNLVHSEAGDTEPGVFFTHPYLSREAFEGCCGLPLHLKRPFFTMI